MEQLTRKINTYSSNERNQCFNNFLNGSFQNHNDHHLLYLINNLSEVIFQTDKKGQFTFLNKAWETLTRYKIEESLGKTSFEYLYAADKEKNKNQVRKIFDKQVNEVSYSARYLTKEKELRWVEIFVNGILDKQGNVIGTSGTLRDITHNIQARQEIKQLNVALEASSDGFAIIDSRGFYTYVNHSHALIMGYNSEEEIIGKSWRIFYSEPELKRINHEIFPELYKNGYWRGEMEATRKDGAILSQELTLTLLHDNKIVCNLRDNTEKKNNEIRLKETLEQYNLALESANDGIWDWDLRSDEIKFSRRFQEILGYDEQDPMPEQFETWKKNIHPDDREMIFNALQELFDGHQESLGEYHIRMKHKDGSYKWTANKGKFARLESGTPYRFVGIMRDIDKQKRAEDKLKESENNLSALINNNQDAIWSVDENYRIITYNNFFKKIYRKYYNTELKKGQYILEPLSQEEQQFWIKKYNYALQGNQFKFDANVPYKGIPRNLEIYYNPILNENNKAIGVGVFTKDVTERKNYEEKILKVQQDLEETQRIASVGGWEYNFQTHKVYLTREGRKILNIKQEEEISPFQALRFFDHFSKRELVKALNQTRNTCEGFTLEALLINNKEINTRVRIIGEPHFDKHKIYKITGAIQDITEIKYAQEERDRIFELSVDLICIADIYGNIKQINPAWNTTLGWSLEELQSKTPAELIHPDDLEATKEKIRMLKKQDSVYSFENRILNKAGNYIWLSWNILTAEGGGLIYAIARDVTKEKKIRQDLINAKETAERASKAKAEFLSVMSHEIRTPMNAVIGMTHLLLEQNPREEQLKNLKALKFSSENLLALINDVLDFGKIEAGKIEFENVEFHISEIINGIYQSHIYNARKKAITLNFYIDEGIPEKLTGDPTRLSQILNNLIGNAVKFTHQGYVNLYIRLLDKDHEKTEVYFSVEDSGIGISEEKIHNIFNLFTQAERYTTRKYGGTGLGLAITQKLIHLQGREISVESQKGNGTKFYFSLPFGISTPQTTKTPGNTIQQQTCMHNLEGYKALLVEDNSMNVMVLRQFLSKWGISLTIAENGEMALEQLKKNHENDFDIILMDIHMPVMDGYETAEKIRSMNNGLKNIPVIGLTASAISEGKNNKCYKNGISDFLTKPINPDELYNKILNLLNKRQNQITT